MIIYPVFCWSMFALPSLLAVSLWFAKPPLGSDARITVNNPNENATFQIVGINREGREIGPEGFSASPDQVTVGRNRPRQAFIRFDPGILWAVCAVSITKSDPKALNNSGALGQVAVRLRVCKRYPPSP
jgi:hypothetical protein